MFNYSLLISDWSESTMKKRFFLTIFNYLPNSLGEMVILIVKQNDLNCFWFVMPGACPVKLPKYFHLDANGLE